MASFGGALDFNQDDTGDGGSSSLVSSILTSATSLGQSYILSQQAPNPVLSYPVAPPSSIGYGGATSPFSLTGKSNSSMLILLVVLIAAAFFFVKK